MTLLLNFGSTGETDAVNQPALKYSASGILFTKAGVAKWSGCLHGEKFSIHNSFILCGFITAIDPFTPV